MSEFEFNNRIGEKNINNFGSKMVIVAYRKSIDIDVFFPQYNWTCYSTTYKCFKTGTIKCPYEPRAYNKGYLGESNSFTKVNNKHIKKIYDIWRQMLYRCYSQKSIKKNPTYENCDVCEEWLNFQNFVNWFEKNYYEVETQSMCLDKDILVKGNKTYSPKTCIFVPQEINKLFTKRQLHRGKYPVGVSIHDKKSLKLKYVAHINKKDKFINLGRYNTPEEAFLAYKKAKEEYIKEVADKYKDQIPQKLYDAMYKYEVEITD